MQFIFALFVLGASVAFAAFSSPPSSLPPPPSTPRMPAPLVQSIPPPPPPAGGTPSSWFGSLFNRPTPPPVPSAITIPSKPEEEQEEVETPDDLFKPLSDAELQTYKDAAKEKCLNILIASQQRGFYYNGEPIDLGEMVPDIFVNEARIAGDRLAYVMRRAKDGRNYVIVDGEVIGPTSVIPDAHRTVLQLNKKHFAYIMKAEYIRKEFRSVLHLIFDGKDLGEIIAPFDYKLKDDYIIYNKKTADNSWPLYVNDKKVANGSFADFDGKNFGYLPFGTSGREDAKLTLNGKKLGYGGDLTLKDGHRAYILGRTANVIDPKVYYDGKIIGPGHKPMIEKNHLAYLRARADIDKKSTDIRPKVIYDGKEYGYVAGYGWNVSMARDNMAYVRLPDEYVDPYKQQETQEVIAYINIDGKDFPGTFDWNDTYVQIAEKVDKSMCNIK